MLIIALVKGVPGRTTKVERTDNILQRQQMEMVINPNDETAIKAADYLKRRVGGKIVSLSMGPDARLKPILTPLYQTEATGVDEVMILSDPRLAGSDTVATAYAVGHAVYQIYDRHVKPLDELIALLGSNASKDAVEAKARDLYGQNLLPNKVYNDQPGTKASIIGHYVHEDISKDETVKRLEAEKTEVSKFVVVAGIRTSDGETGSVGPQVAEVLAEMIKLEVPHTTYVEELDIDPETLKIFASRRIGRFIQKLEIDTPCLLTFAPEYVPQPIKSVDFHSMMQNYYKGKVLEPMKWTADVLNADPARLGFGGSAVIVGPAIIMGRPASQKTVEKTLVFTASVNKRTIDGKDYGPFQKGDVADSLPETMKSELFAKGEIVTYSLKMMGEELLA
ncbi:MAG: hypothetical protein OK455_09790 [Thaumarchaeota archaeon]|nr:hypothetical protein [Nitrososphaerota archaeon]